MRNATCVGTETSKVPTRVTLLFIFYSVIKTAIRDKVNNREIDREHTRQVNFIKIYILAHILKVSKIYTIVDHNTTHAWAACGYEAIRSFSFYGAG